MKTLMIAAGAAALITASSLAGFAGEASGAIASVDTSAGTVTLDNGQTFILPSNLDAASLQPGEKIMILYEESPDGKMQASQVAPAN